MGFTREQAYAALESLRPALVFLDSYRVDRLPENLQVCFGPPEEFFVAVDSQEPYTAGRMVPILDDGNFDRVIFLDPQTRSLVQFDIESPGAPVVVFRHWQQYLADLMLRIGDWVDDDQRLRRMAGLIGFAHIDELFAFFASAEAMTGEAWWEACRQVTVHGVKPLVFKGFAERDGCFEA